MPSRVAVYVDGLNLFHALDTFSFRSIEEGGADLRHLKWLCLNTLARHLIRSKSESVEKVKYFTAFAEHLKGTKPHLLMQQITYQRAVAAQGAECIMGRFKKKRVWCSVCNAYRPTREEKETDVNLAVSLLDDAYQDVFDTFLVISTDTDFHPAISLVKRRFPEKQFVTVSPPGRPHAQELLALADRHASITERMLESSRLPELIQLSNGKIIHCPPDFCLPQSPT